MALRRVCICFELGVGLEVGAADGVLAFAGEDLGEDANHFFVAQALGDLVEEAEVVVERRHVLGELFALELRAALAVANDHAVGGALHHHLHVLALVLDVLLELALLDAVERRLRDVDVAALDQLLSCGGRRR